jgi:predicted acylesterase/phospholipase RssA/ABC-type phosphate/phosphonate transport system substrate-binding protein
MKLRRFRLLLILSLLAMLVAAFQPESRPSHANSAPPRPSSATDKETNPAQVLKVGVTEYQNLEKAYANYERLFSQLAKVSRDLNQPIRFQFAIGNYGEVLEWYNRGDIDVAVLSAMPVAKLLLQAGDADLDKIDEAYIGDVRVDEPIEGSTSEITDKFAELLKKDSAFTYRSVCLTLASDPDLGPMKDGTPRSIEDVRRVWNNSGDKKPFKFLFVRPYSLSGYIVPRHILSQIGIKVKPDQMEFSYSHGTSLQKLIEEQRKPAARRTRYVAFVLEGTRYKPDPQNPHLFEQIKVPALQNVNIPREKVFVNHNLDAKRFQQYKQLLQGLFENWEGNPDGLTLQLKGRSANWREEYRDSNAAVADVAVPRQLLYKTRIQELLEDFARYVDQPRDKDRPAPRLALVLSGGGAKCAYQAGAIAAIETKLRQINEKRAEASRPAIDIDLVVGTSGGAINALLVAAGVTKAGSAADELARLWGSFSQQQFFQPSFRFNLGFGLCFGLMQALLITIAVLLFGRDTVNWLAIAIGIAFLLAIEIGFVWYFGVKLANFAKSLLGQAVVLGVTIGVVQGVGVLITWVIRKEPKRFGRPLKFFAKDPHHWRLLTVVLMLTVSVLEIFIAKCPGLDDRVTHLGHSHWLHHGWMMVTLVCSWSFPYPLLIGLFIAGLGAVVWRTFDSTTHRPILVWAMGVLLVVGAIGLVMETFFRASAPSKATGIEQAFAEMLPRLIRATIQPDFATASTTNDETALQQISKQLMDPNQPMLQRDLVITSSRLPIDLSNEISDENNPESLRAQRQAELVNGLHDDLYFYFRANKDAALTPPLDRRFIPLKRNPDKLIDVVIGSSTIYPIFPSRVLTNVKLGNEEKEERDDIDKMSIVDGGYIHNIPIEAAVKWKASHIILIEASPSAAQNMPKDFWDHSMTAFGYLFNQAQLTDKLVRGAAETFELRPTSSCEKQDTLPSCVGPANTPDPNMDTFDFTPQLVKNAFDRGMNDVNDTKPLFMRVPGPPLFRSVAETPEILWSSARSNYSRAAAVTRISSRKRTFERVSNRQVRVAPGTGRSGN